MLSITQPQVQDNNKGSRTGCKECQPNYTGYYRSYALEDDGLVNCEDCGAFKLDGLLVRYNWKRCKECGTPHRMLDTHICYNKLSREEFNVILAGESTTYNGYQKTIEMIDIQRKQKFMISLLKEAIDDCQTMSTIERMEPVKRGIRVSANTACAIGRLYEKGRGGIKKNTKFGFNIYLQAAIEGYLTAQVCIGFYFLLGRCVPKNLYAAHHWLEKGALRGNAVAQFQLALMFQKGNGCVKSDTQYVRWLSAASNNGLAQASLVLSKVYTYGVYGVSPCMITGLNLMIDAGEKGYVKWAELYNFYSRGYAMELKNMSSEGEGESKIDFSTQRTV